MNFHEFVEGPILGLWQRLGTSFVFCQCPWEKLRRSSVRAAEQATARVLPKQCATHLSCILGAVRAKSSLPLAHVVFIVKRVHNNMSNSKKYAQHVCGNQNYASFAGKSLLRKKTPVGKALPRALLFHQ